MILENYLSKKIIIEENNFYYIWFMKKLVQKMTPEEDYYIWLEVILYRNMIKFINIPFKIKNILISE